MLDHRIDTFLTLYDEMNYRRTAEKLSMTQPGVTQHIHYLENYYGVKLFQYDGRTLSKTKNAERLKRHFDSIRAEETAVRSLFKPDDMIRLHIGATKTIGEFVIIPEVYRFLQKENHCLELVVDNTEHLLGMLERQELDFAIVEGVFNKEKYGYHLYKKENFVGICAAGHPFAGRTITLEEAFGEEIIVREKGSGTRLLLERAVENRGFSLEHFRRCTAISNFSVICELVVRNQAITFAYEPISRCSPDIATFWIEDMEIKGEFNFVYCNESIARSKIKQIF